MLEAILDRDDSGMDEGERERAASFSSHLAKRRWPPGTFDTPADRTRRTRQQQLAQRELVIRRIP